MIGIIDYQAGNITSVARALKFLGWNHVVTREKKVLAEVSHLIFPGVGAAGSAMAYLKQERLDIWIKEFVRSGRPTLGICLGTQIILNYSEEDDTSCLGIISGTVRKFPETITSKERLKVPHMGWNQVDLTRIHPVFQNISKEAEFYFVHSFYPEPEEDLLILGRTDYGINFCSVLARDNLVAVQFHPEKSGPSGLKLLDNFCRWEGIDVK